MKLPLLFLFFVLFQGAVLVLKADEGMWLVNQFPADKVKKAYGFAPNKDWLNKVQLSSVKLGGGCSGSFISSSGLVMTNHHCVEECVEQLSSTSSNLIADGFYAKTLSDEKRCPDFEVQRLIEIKDVTAQVSAKLQGKQGEEFQKAKKQIISELESACTQGSSENFQCLVVTLYKGAQFHLYKYERYHDMRLVFVPEFKISFFGGDPDNFMFPRYDLDMALLRAYKEGKPVQNSHYFSWSKNPVKEGDLTFVTGNPGRTNRLSTVAELEFLRSTRTPDSLIYQSELRGVLTQARTSNEKIKIASHDILFGIENSIKNRWGGLKALNNQKLMDTKIKEEARLRTLSKEPFLAIEKAFHRYKEIYPSWRYLESGDGYSRLFRMAKILYRSGAELEKPNEKRFHEYTDSKIVRLKSEVFNETELNTDLEEMLIKFYFIKLREVLTPDHELVKKLFKNQSPEKLAHELVEKTKIKNLKARKELFGHRDLIEKAKDPLLDLVAIMDIESRKVREIYETEVDPVLIANYEKIANLRNKLYGTSVYPDATSTLRIAYGSIKGFKEGDHYVSPITRMGGVFERATGYEPFELPMSWIKTKDKINLETPFNLSSTNDIIGGNSGSPMINKEAEIVGLIFDGNIHSLGGDYFFDPELNRAVSVSGLGILEALKKVYKADRIVDELNTH